MYRYTVMSAEHEDTERYPSAKFTFQVVKTYLCMLGGVSFTRRAGQLCVCPFKPLLLRHVTHAQGVSEREIEHTHTTPHCNIPQLWRVVCVTARGWVGVCTYCTLPAVNTDLPNGGGDLGGVGASGEWVFPPSLLSDTNPPRKHTIHPSDRKRTDS